MRPATPPSETTQAGSGGSTRPRSVEVLYVDGCPHYQALLAHIEDLALLAGVRVRIRLRHIPDESTAVRERFLGSPTVRVEGRDVEPGADLRNNYGLACRCYDTDQGPRGLPPDQWVLDALTTAVPE